MAAERVEIIIAGESRPYQVAAEQAERSTKELGRTVREENAKSAASTKDATAANDRFNLSLGDGQRNAGGLGKALSAFKWPAFIAGAGGAAQGVAALGAGAIGLTSALGPLTGLLAAYPALLGAFGQAAGVVALANVDDLTAAVGGLHDKLDETSKEFKQLTPEAQAFARELQAAKAPMRELQTTAQGPLFAGLDKGLEQAMENFPELKQVIGDTADVLGDLAEKAGHFAGRDGFGKDFQSIGESNAALLGDLGSAGFHFADALRHVMVAAEPMIDWLGKGIDSFAAWVEAEAEAGRKTGELGDFFERTEETMERVVSIGGSLADVLGEIFGAASPLGSDILKALDRGAEDLERWANSTEGRNSLRQFFDDAQPAIFEAGRLVGDLTTSFFDLADTPGLEDFIHRVRVDLLPALVNVTEATTAAFGPALIDALTEGARLFEKIGGSSGPLVVFAEMMADILGLLNDLIDEFPVLGTVIATSLGASSVFNALKIGAALTGMTSLIGLLKKAGGIGAASSLFAAGVGPGLAMSEVGGKAGTRFGTSFAGATGPLIVAAIVAAAVTALDKTDERFQKYKEELRQQISGLESGDVKAGVTLRALDAGKLGPFLKGMAEAGEAIDKNMVRGWLRAGDISVEEAGRMIAAIERVNQKAGALARQNSERLGFGFASALAKDGKLLTPELKKIFNQLEALPKKGRDVAARAMIDMTRVMESMGKLPEGSAHKLVQALEDQYGKIPENADKSGKDAYSNFDGWMKKTADMGGQRGKDFRDGWVGHVDSLVTGTGRGLIALKNNTNKALKAFNVKPVNFGISGSQPGESPLAPQGVQKGGVIHAAMGQMVPGTGSGDKVPAILPVGTGIVNKKAARALLEPGELSFGPREVAKMGGPAAINAINQAVPRFAGGGIIQQALGPYDMPPIVYDPNHAGSNSHLHMDFFTGGQAISIGQQMQKMGWTVGEFSGPGSAGFGPVTVHHESPGHYDGTAFDANTASDETRSEVAAVVRLLGGGAGAVGAVVEKIARQILKGPDGPLKDMGQAALDKVRSAANQFIAAKAPASVGGGVSTMPGGGSFQAGAGALSKAEMRSLMGKVGLPDIFGYIAEAESGLNPMARNASGASGLWQIMMPLHSALVEQAGGNVFDPLTNAKVASMLSGGGSNLVPWAASQSKWGSRVGQAYQRGGVVAKLAEGGLVGDQAYTPSHLSGQGVAGQQWTISATGAGVGSGSDSTKNIAGKIANVKRRLSDLQDKLTQSRPSDDERERIQKVKSLLEGGGLGRDRRHKLEAELKELQGSQENLSPEQRQRLQDQEKALEQRLAELRAALAKKREQRAKKLAKKGLGGKLRGTLGGLEAQDDDLIERIDIADRLAGAESGAGTDGGSDFTQGEVDKLGGLYNERLGVLGTERTTIKALLERLDGQIESDQKLIDKKDTPAWKRAALRKNRDAAKAFAETARDQLVNVEGRTGEGGYLFDVRMALADLGVTPPGEDENATALAELYKQKAFTEGIRANLSEAHLGVFSEFFQGLSGLPFLGTFAAGTRGRRIPHNGIGFLHRDEQVIPDPEGPHGTQPGVGGAPSSSGPSKLVLYVDSDLAPLMGRVRAEIDGRQLQIEQSVDRGLGRRARQRATAPGR